MRLSRVISVIGRLYIFFSFFLLVPIPVAFYFGENTHKDFFISFLFVFALGLSFLLIFGKPQEISVKEGIFIVGLTWISISIFGAIPFILTGSIPSFTDSFFESTSGFTTTGASVLKDIEVLPKSVLLWRNLIQWVGGMGVIAIAVAIMPHLGLGGAHLFKAEVPGPTKDKISPRISQTARILWETYVLISLFQILLLFLGGLDLFDATCITFGTMATGGYAPYSDSLARFDSSYIHYVVTAFMFLAAVNFNLHFQAISGRPSSYLRSTEFKFFSLVVLISALSVILIRKIEGDELCEEMIRHSLFQVVSIVTTTGFVTEDYELWPFNAQIILILLMLHGGCSGSTGGAIKSIRIYVMGSFLVSHLKKIFRPHGVFPVRVDGKVVEESVASNILAFIILYLLLFLSGVLVLTYQDVSIDTSVGATLATLGNVGPGIGGVGPTDNYADLPTFSKWFLSFLMLAGRLEIYTILVLFLPDFWRD